MEKVQIVSVFFYGLYLSDVLTKFNLTVGVTGSGKGMTENAPRPKNKFSAEEENS